jgi:hypothetical protein
MLTSINQYDVPATPEREIWEVETQIGHENFIVASEAFTLVLGRSVRDNVNLCSGLAIEVARSGRTTLLLNTFATRDRMVMSLEAARGENLQLFIENVPIGEWDTDKVEELAKAAGVEAIFINSFEFAALTQWQKGRVANALLKLQRRTGIPIVLFSHRVDQPIAAGDVARGPLGILTPFAVQVVHLGSLRSTSNTLAQRRSATAAPQAAEQAAQAAEQAPQAAEQAPQAAEQAAQAAEQGAVNEKAIEVRESEPTPHATPKSIHDTSFVLSRPNPARRNAATAMVGT